MSRKAQIKRMPLISRRPLLLSVGAGLLPKHATAQPESPDRAIRIMIGFTTGGGSDLVARAIAPAIQQRKSRAVTVEHRSGSAGLTMIEILRKAPPDGSIVGMLPSTVWLRRLTTPATFPVDPLLDLTPLGIIGTFEMAFCVSPATNARTIEEYVKWVKEGPESRRRFGTAAPNTFSQYFAQLIGQQYGVSLEPVPFNGTGPLSSDLAQGRIPAGCGGLASFVHQHRGAGLRILVISGAVRNPVLPDVPTVVELGLENLQLVDWYAFFAPGGLPPRLIAAWNRELISAVERPDVRAQLMQYGLSVDVSKPDECSVRLASDLIRWRKLLDMLGIQTAN